MKGARRLQGRVTVLVGQVLDHHRVPLNNHLLMVADVGDLGVILNISAADRVMVAFCSEIAL